MADKLHNQPDTDVLPVRQRIAWMAAVWLLSAGAMVLATIAIRSLIS